MCDFGLSKKVTDINRLNETFCGSPDYLSPEVIRKQGYNYMRDIFSLGVLAYELLHGYTPFFAQEIKEIYSRILADQPIINKSVSSDCVNFILSCLEKDPKKRIGCINGMPDILSHPWIRTFVYNITRENHKHNPFQNYIERRPPINSENPNLTSQKLLNDWFQAEAVNGTDKRYFDFSFRHSVDKPEEYPDIEDHHHFSNTSNRDLSQDSIYDTKSTAHPQKFRIKIANNIQLHS